MRLRSLRAFSFVRLLAACADAEGIERAAQEFDLPVTFELLTAEALNGHEALQGELRFSTEVSAIDACDATRAALADWSGGAAPEDRDLLPRDVCRFIVLEPEGVRGVDYAWVVVSRRTRGPGAGDDLAPGSVDEVLVAFAKDH